jgi:hypothetical protein
VLVITQAFQESSLVIVRWCNMIGFADDAVFLKYAILDAHLALAAGEPAATNALDLHPHLAGSI